MYNKLPNYNQLKREFRGTIFLSMRDRLYHAHKENRSHDVELDISFIRGILPEGAIGNMCKSFNYNPSEVAECIINSVVVDINDIKWWLDEKCR